jgi:putative SOS response-associated peptidase YedK
LLRARGMSGDVPAERGTKAPRQDPSALWANYNVAPTTPVLAVVDRHEEESAAVTRRVREMRWGLLPHWMKDLAKAPVLFNARAETVGEKAAFRTAFAGKRCLVPMDGWYEWQQREQFSAGGRGRVVKHPLYMTRRDGGRLYMAGLWSTWRPPGSSAEDTAPLLSCTVLTTDSVGPLAQVHDRMPLILTPDQWDRWLDPDLPGPQELLTAPSADLVESIEVRSVRPLVNSVRNNGPELIVPDEPEVEATLF